MLSTVTLYGVLGETFGKNWSLDIDSPAEAVRALMANNPKVRQFLLESEKNGLAYKVKVGESYIGEDGLFNPLGRQSIQIIPVVIGSGKKQRKGFGQIILGAVLVTVGFMLGPASPWGKIIIQAGIGMMLQGVATLLAPTPDKGEQAEQTQGYAFNGPEITINQGVPIPVCYGQLIIGGALISSGIIAEEYDP